MFRWEILNTFGFFQNKKKGENPSLPTDLSSPISSTSQSSLKPNSHLTSFLNRSLSLRIERQA